MTGGTLDKLPPLHPPATKAGGKAWAKKAPAPKTVLPVTEVKKAAKLLKGFGKSVAVIEALPGGGFRVIAAEKGTEKASPANPFDKLLE